MRALLVSLLTSLPLSVTITANAGTGTMIAGDSSVAVAIGEDMANQSLVIDGDAAAYLFDKLAGAEIRTLGIAQKAAGPIQCQKFSEQTITCSIRLDVRDGKVEGTKAP